MTRPNPNGAAPERLVTRSRAAAIKGVSTSGVSKACRPGGALEPALRGRKVDTEHAAFIAWLSEPTRGPDAAPEAASLPADASAPADKGAQGPTKAEMLALSKRKREAECEKLEIANATRLGELISWELVSHHVFGLIDACFKRLLGDVPRTLTARLYALGKSNATVEEGSSIVRDLITRQLRSLKDSAARKLQRDPKQDGARSAARARKRNTKPRKKGAAK